MLADATIAEVKPERWAAAAVALYHALEADALVAEVNQGGDMVTAVIRTADGGVPVKAVRARRGKWTRAEPVALLYAQGRVVHAGRFPDYGSDRRCRGAAEVEAESIAYIVTSHLGMNPAAYSIPYVAGWADDLDVLRHHMSTVVTASQWILGDLGEQMSIGARAVVLPARPAALEHGGRPNLPSASTDLTCARSGMQDL